MEEAGVDGALIVQPISHKFDHSYVTRYMSSTFFFPNLMEEKPNDLSYIWINSLIKCSLMLIIKVLIYKLFLQQR